jgi:protein gp37
VPETLNDLLSEPGAKTIFLNSMSDTFGEFASDKCINAMYAVMAACRRHTFQVLTKRSERMLAWYEATGEALLRDREGTLRSMVKDAQDYLVKLEWESFIARFGGIDGFSWPLPNVWLGVSAEDQRYADERIAQLVMVPAKVRFVSAEPLLGPIDLSEWIAPRSHCASCDTVHDGIPDLCPSCSTDNLVTTWGRAQEERLQNGERWTTAEGRCDREDGPPLRWIITGAESGGRARPMQDQWVRSLRDQCADAGVPFFYKQRLDKGRKVSLPLLDGVRHDAMPLVSPAQGSLALGASTVQGRKS